MPLSLSNLLEKQHVSEAASRMASLLDGLRGNTLVIPDIESLSPRWAVKVNPYLASVRAEYNEWVQLYV